MRIPSLLRVLLALPLLGCGETGGEAPPALQGAAGESGSLREDTVARPALLPPLDETSARVVFLGTSLTEGYGLARPELEGWPARIGELAAATGRPVRILNAGSAGETSAGAVRRMDWLLREPLDLLVIETGANDGLRGLPVSDLEANLDAILRALRERAPEARAAIVAMEAPPNLGPEYVEAFRAVYGRVAERWGATLIPFPLQGVAGVPALNQEDGIHPTASGHRIMADNVWPVLDSLLGLP